MSSPINANWISITACDNELYIVAAPASGGPSTELCHIMSGYNQPVSYQFSPGAVLSSNQNPYNLYIMGINWGAAADFAVAIGVTGGTMMPFTYSADPSDPLVWSPTGVPPINVSLS